MTIINLLFLTVTITISWSIGVHKRRCWRFHYVRRSPVVWNRRIGCWWFYRSICDGWVVSRGHYIRMDRSLASEEPLGMFIRRSDAMEEHCLIQGETRFLQEVSSWSRTFTHRSPMSGRRVAFCPSDDWVNPLFEHFTWHPFGAVGIVQWGHGCWSCFVGLDSSPAADWVSVLTQDWSVLGLIREKRTSNPLETLLCYTVSIPSHMRIGQ